MGNRRASLVVALAAGALLLGFTACVNPGESLRAERAALGAELHARIGVEQVPGAAADPATPDRAAALAELAATPLDPDGAVRAAFALQPRVREELSSLDAAAAARVKAVLLRNPLLGLQATAGGGGTGVELTLVQPLFELLSLPARRAAADRALEAARFLSARELVELSFDVRRAWVAAHAAEGVEKLAAERLEAEEAATRLARELDAAGNLTPSFVARIETARADARLARLAAGEETRRARRTLATRIGAPELANGLALADADDDAATTVPAAPELESAALRASLELSEQEARVQFFERRAGIESRRARLGDPHAGIAAQRESGDWGAGPRIDVAIPVFDDGRADRVLWLARAEAARQRRESLELEVRSAAHGASERLERLLELSRAANDDALPFARRTVDAVLQQYNAMQVGVFDVLEARRAELEAERRALEITRLATLARLDLEQLLAGVLPAGATSHASPGPESPDRASPGHASPASNEES